MAINVLNTDADLSGKRILTAENAETITGLKTFSRSPNPPFAVAASSAAVANLDADKLDGQHASDIIGAAAPAGSIVMFAGAAAPSGWLLCDGSAVSRTTFASLFAVIGTTYGAGDGSTTFNLPNLKQRFPLGKADSGTGSVLGSTGGAIDHVHTGPSHTHSFSATTSGPSASAVVQSGSPATAASDAHTHSVSGTTGASGTGNTGSANPPFIALNFIIKS